MQSAASRPPPVPALVGGHSSADSCRTRGRFWLKTKLQKRLQGCRVYAATAAVAKTALARPLGGLPRKVWTTFRNRSWIHKRIHSLQVWRLRRGAAPPQRRRGLSPLVRGTGKLFGEAAATVGTSDNWAVGGPVVIATDSRSALFRPQLPIRQLCSECARPLINCSQDGNQESN